MNSTAKGQRCLYCGEQFPLYPPLVKGCPACATDDFKAPVEVVYEYPSEAGWFPSVPFPGLTRYATVLPPLAKGLSMGEGGTPLIEWPGRGASADITLFVKDESRNPTWSHKDRLNLVVVSAAVNLGSPGIVAASSGNHGASAAAYAARAGLPAVILSTTRPPAVASFLQAYGQVVVAAPDVQTRWALLERLVDEFQYHPVSNQTLPPTNHPFGSEGYKTIAYELFLQLGRRIPEAVFLPVGFAELAFGVYKGFKELLSWGLSDALPRIVACEPAAGAPLRRALDEGVPIATVDPGPTEAYAIAVPVNSYRGVVAVAESNGIALAVEEDETRHAQRALAQSGIWAEFSAAVAFAGALQASRLGIGERGPVVCINTSSGFKDLHVGERPLPQIDGSWEALLAAMREHWPGSG